MRTSALNSIAPSDLQHTIGHIDCPACEAARLALAKTTDLKLLKFSEAAAVCLDDEVHFTNISPRTHEDHVKHAAMLGRFFAEIPLQKIHEGHILSYQQQRAAGAITGRNAGPDRINHEISFLSFVLDKAGLWKSLAPKVNRLAVPKSKRGRAYTSDERERLLFFASTNPRWWVAYLCTLLLANIPSGNAEILSTKVENIDMRNRVLMIIERTKNDYRKRGIPMTDTIKWICQQLLDRYHEICERQGIQPSGDHYVLPFLQTASRRGKSGVASSSSSSYDLTRPMSSYRSAWESLREKAGLPKARVYDWRHSKATEFMEDAEISEHVIDELMGHGSKEMKRQYRHIRDKAKLAALERHEVKPVPRMVDSPSGPIAIPILPDKPKPPARAEEAEHVQVINSERK